MGRTCSTHENTYSILFRKPEGNRLSGRTKRRWENNIRMDLREIG